MLFEVLTSFDLKFIITIYFPLYSLIKPSYKVIFVSEPWISSSLNDSKESPICWRVGAYNSDKGFDKHHML